MSENCSHNCGSCSSNCSNRKPADFLVAPNPHSSIKKVIGVVSGKGGVGKSMVPREKANRPPFWMQISQVLPFPRLLA